MAFTLGRRPLHTGEPRTINLSNYSFGMGETAHPIRQVPKKILNRKDLKDHKGTSWPLFL